MKGLVALNDAQIVDAIKSRSVDLLMTSLDRALIVSSESFEDVILAVAGAIARRTKSDLGAAGRESDQRERANESPLGTGDSLRTNAPVDSKSDASTRDVAGAASRIPRRRTECGSFARKGHYGPDSDLVMQAFIDAADGPRLPALIIAAPDVHGWMLDAIERHHGVKITGGFFYRGTPWHVCGLSKPGTLRVFDFNGDLAAEYEGWAP